MAAAAAAAGRAAAALPLRVVRAAGATVLAQLRLEETLLRHGAGSWLVVNDGVGGAGGAGGGAGERDWTEPRPVAVLGVSGRVQELLDVQRCVDAGVGAVRRFTGGGTIVADENTIMVSAVVAGGVKDALVQPYPDPIMRFMGGVYGDALSTLGTPTASELGGAKERLHAPFEGFALRENDFALGGRKFGGNAQYISRGRWVHHTSLLWDYDDHTMGMLRQPPKQPEWRRGRAHSDFVCKLRQELPPGVSRADVCDALVDAVGRALGTPSVESVGLGDALAHAAELEAQEREAAAAIGRRVRPSANKLLDLREWLHAEDESS